MMTKPTQTGRFRVILRRAIFGLEKQFRIAAGAEVLEKFGCVRGVETAGRGRAELQTGAAFDTSSGVAGGDTVGRKRYDPRGADFDAGAAAGA